MNHSDLILVEILGALTSIGTIGNIILYIGGFFRNLENNVQQEASHQNTRITRLEAQVDTLLKQS